MMWVAGAVVGVCLFIACAIAAEKNMIWVPVIVVVTWGILGLL